MKKFTAVLATCLLITNGVLADTAFDSMGKATEVKLSPAINTTTTNSASTNTSTINAVNQSGAKKLKEEKYTSAISNLEDAQIELRQELSVKTSQYNSALAEKEKVTQNCKALKKEVKNINQKMKNIEKSKKIINKNLQSDT